MSRSRVADNLLLALTYVLLGYVGLLIAVPPGYASIIWPPSGIAMGAVLVQGPWLLPGIFLGSFTLNAATGPAYTFEGGWNETRLAIAAGIALGSTLQALAARALFISIFGMPLRLERLVDVARALAVVVPGSCMIAATFGVASLYAGGVMPAADVINNWLTWWMGDVLGVVIFLPLMLVAPGAGALILWRGQPLGTLPTAAVVVLLLPLGLTFYAWKASKTYIYEKNLSQFQNLASENRRALIDRLDSYTGALLGGVGHYVGARQFSDASWAAYVDAIDLPRHWPGLRGMGFIEKVEAGDVDAFVAARRRALPEYHVRPEGSGPPFYIVSIVAHSPMALGLNIAFEERRRAAAELAMATGKTAITRRISLVNAGGPAAGMLVLHPIYRKDAPLGSENDRRTALIGWIYATLLAQAFLDGLTESQGRLLRLEVFDGEEASDEGLLFDSLGVAAARVADAPDFVVEETVTIMQQRWRLRWTSMPAFERGIANHEPIAILLAGLMFSALFASLLMQFAQRTAIVRSLVDAKTQELSEREHLYRLLADNASDMISRVSLDGVRRYTSPACRQILGYTSEELLGARIVHVLHARHTTEVEALLADLAAGRIDRAEGVYDSQRKDGTWVKTEKVFQLVRDEADGTPIELVVTTRDVTLRERRAEELRRAIAAAEEASRAKSEFMATMSHEVRTPLNSIIGFTRLTLDRQGLDTATRRELKIVHDASHALLSLVNDILDYSAIEAGQLKLVSSPTNLLGVLRECQSLMQVAAEAKGIAAVLDVPGTLDGLLVDVDGRRLRQVLLNLQSNAIKFTEVGSVRTIVTAEGPADGVVRVRFAVTDTGPGIPPSAKSRLFIRFSQLDHGRDRRFGGSGLGLAICQRLVEGMGGRIEVDSTVGVGSSFSFELNLKTSASSTDCAEARDRGSAPSRLPLRVLVVDDMEVNRDLTAAVLTQAGHVVEGAASGQEAIRRIREARYDVVLMDVQMPEMDGIAATRAIRALGGDAGNVPIIAMTANVLLDEVELCRSAGMNDHIGKPFEWADLLDKVARAGRQRKAGELARPGALAGAE
ncbi:MAG: CHASE domain-containing protein [Hyphomicrobiaceae bacterium]|nr:CHASE domain-containing protein [Hyphomicrobiaceae bacterium]